MESGELELIWLEKFLSIVIPLVVCNDVNRTCSSMKMLGPHPQR